MPRLSRRLILATAVAVTLIGCSGNGLDEAAPTTTQRSTTSTASTTTTTPSSAPDGPAPAQPAPAGSGFPDNWQPDPLTWTACRDERSFQCAKLNVPLNWSDPNGTQITLAVARRSATGQRIGTLFSNPGGPGASGLEYLFSNPLATALSSRFDLVSWDPRGVGSSTRVACGGDSVSDFLHLDPDPDDEQEQAAIDTAAKRIADECGATDGDFLRYVGTDDTARDLEALRIAMGDSKLTYIGFSYGTFIGERYLALFPTHVRAIVLDGVVDPTEGLTDLLRGQTVAMTQALQRAFDTCTRASGCSVTDAAATYTQIHSKVETDPLPTGGRPLGPAELATGAIYATYSPSLWPSLNKAISQAAAGNGRGMSDLADGYYDIGDWTAYAAISCLDSERPTGSAEYRAFVDELRTLSPNFGGAIGNEMLPCAYWPVAPKSARGEVTAADSPDILVVGNVGDAATPYDDAVAVSKMLAHGHLLTYHGEGHTSYGQDSCVDSYIHDYLINLKVPPAEAKCESSGTAAP